jgi:hypothetical protein
MLVQRPAAGAACPAMNPSPGHGLGTPIGCRCAATGWERLPNAPQRRTADDN